MQGCPQDWCFDCYYSIRCLLHRDSIIILGAKQRGMKDNVLQDFQRLSIFAECTSFQSQSASQIGNSSWNPRTEAIHDMKCFVYFSKIDKRTSKFCNQSRHLFGLQMGIPNQGSSLKRLTLLITLQDGIIIIEMAKHHNYLDWREAESAVTPVRDQGQFPTCWAVASTDLVWMNCKIQKIEGAELLSAQQLDDHCNPWRPEQEKYKYGYKLTRAFDYMKNVGLHKEDDYRYVGVKDARRKATGGRPYKIVSYCNIPEDNEQELLDILSEHPVVISYPCYREVVDLKKDEIYEFIKRKGVKPEHHAFILIGYGVEDPDAEVKSLYWVVKSSWGEQWADDGYGKIRRVKGEVPFHSFYPLLDREMFRQARKQFKSG